MDSSLLNKLHTRSEAGHPLRVGLIGAGKFGTMYLSQAHRVQGLHVAGVADLSKERIREAFLCAEWPEEQTDARDMDQAIKTGATWQTEDSMALIRADEIEVIIEATGDPIVGARHAMAAIYHGKHIVMVNVEADVLVGPLLAQNAEKAGVVYSLAYGDQPALICELIDWARMNGFEVVCAGKGNKFLPAYHASTPDTVWDYYGFTPEQIEKGGFNPILFNSFLDGTKAAIEMAAVANATGLKPQPHGLGFPPGGIDDIPEICRPETDGGILSHSGTVEVVSSLHRDGRPVERDLRWGVYITFSAPSEYVQRCFGEYGVQTDSTGQYGLLYRPIHFVGLELNVSVLRAGLNGEATGCPTGFLGDIVTIAKRDLAAGEVLDGEGGYLVYGALRPAADGLKTGHLPIGLAHGMRLARPVAAGHPVRWSDIMYEATDPIIKLRRNMEKMFSGKPQYIPKIMPLPS
jgi:predicted homoserine dehydrogenase-like protein